MNSRIALFISTILVLISYPAFSQDLPDKSTVENQAIQGMIATEEIYDNRCRTGDPNDHWTKISCISKDDYAYRLRTFNWCKANSAGAKWHPCAAPHHIAKKNERSELIYASLRNALKVGDVFNHYQALEVLHPQKPCPLPIVNARHMHLYKMLGLNDITVSGCYALTLTDKIIIIREDGDVSERSRIGFVRAALHKDMTATVLGPWSTWSPSLLESRPSAPNIPTPKHSPDDL